MVGAIVTGADIKDDNITLDTDVVIIGSGAGGSVMAYELAAQGKRVVVLEAGNYVKSSEFNEQLPDMIEKLYVDKGAQTNIQGDMAILQGQCVGGSTVVNGCVAFRVPDFILKEWADDHGLTELQSGVLNAYYDKIEKRLSVHENLAYEVNANSRKLVEGAEKLGWSVKPLKRNVKQCGLTGHCLAGCKTDRKQSMLVTYLPWAVEKGATLYADTRVDKILTENGKVVGVKATSYHSESKAKVADVIVNAKVVVLAAGAIQSPALMTRSGIGNSSGFVGKNFACHPSVMVSGLFDQPVHTWRGAMLGSYVDEFEHPEKGGFVLEGGGAGPLEISASTDVGTGLDYVEFINKSKNLASCISLIHDHNVGTVRLENNKVKIDYQLSDKDFPSIIKAVKAAARIYFAAGAKRVYLPTVQSKWVDSEAELDQALADLKNEPFTFRMVSYHPQGTLRMGTDAKKSVVAPNGEAHDVKGLFIADASLFPTSLLVNPQMTIYAMANYLADKLLLESSDYFA